MAAAQYFSSAPMHQSSPPPYQQTLTSHPQAPILSPNVQSPTPSMQAQHPPQYQEQRPGVHFAPTPVEVQQRHSFSGPQRPLQDSWNWPLQQGYGNPYSHQTMALQPYQQQQPYVTPPPQRPQFLSPHMRPHTNPNLSQYPLDNGGYSSDPEPHRRKHKNRHRRDSGEMRSTKSSSRSTTADAFVGAAGGGLLGDLIFPGLGTIGGAAIGWLGGKDYGNYRKGREDKLHKAQRKWEDKYGAHHRSRSRDHSNPDSSTYLGERERRHSGH